MKHPERAADRHRSCHPTQKCVRSCLWTCELLPAFSLTWQCSQAFSRSITFFLRSALGNVSKGESTQCRSWGVCRGALRVLPTFLVPLQQLLDIAQCPPGLGPVKPGSRELLAQWVLSAGAFHIEVAQEQALKAGPWCLSELRARSELQSWNNGVRRLSPTT